MDSSPQLQHVLKKMAETEPTSLPTPSACLAGKCNCCLFSCTCHFNLSMILPKSLQHHHKTLFENGREKNIHP
jgi:hypothetical protein